MRSSGVPSVMAVELLAPDELLAAAGPWALWTAALVVLVECGLLVGVVLPGDTLLLSVGLLASQGLVPQPLWLVVGTLVVAAVAGNAIGYELGRWAGPAVLDGHASSRTARARCFFARYGPAAVVLARFVPVVRTLITVTAGAVGMPRRTYLVFSGVGAVLWAGGLTTLGWAAGRLPLVQTHVQPHLDLVVVVAVALVAVPSAGHLLRERRHRGPAALAQGSSRSAGP